MGEEKFPEVKKNLEDYLNIHWKSPESYVIDKFSEHDIVIIGEVYKVKHDVELIHHLIPFLYKKGIYNLGIEFGSYEYQNKVDELINGKVYDENLARWIFFKNNPTWGYKEYIDIYREAWKLNSSLPEKAPKFRVVNLGYGPAWNEITEEEWNSADRETIMKKVWKFGNYDEYMAQVVSKEFIEKEQKALIYCGMHHAFTGYRQPNYGYKDYQVAFRSFEENRMGQILYRKLEKKIFSICLHYPWASKMEQDDISKSVYPVNGIIDLVMMGLRDKRVGFDLAGTPMGELPDSSSCYSVGYENFTLENFCDGYIFQKNFKDYEGCTVDENFVTDKNLQEVIGTFRPDERKYFYSPAMLIENMKKEADFRMKYQNLQ